jgi:thiamine biosynthesis lipoprotein
MGTMCRVLLRTDSAKKAEAYRDAAMAWVKAFEANYSRFQESSLISTINRAAGDGEWIELDDEAEQLLGLVDTITFLSRGVLDPTSLPLTRIWQWAAKANETPSETKIGETLALVGWQKVERDAGRIRLPKAGMALDLGGYGKEYAVDCVAELGRQFGVTDVLVDFGRDIRALGTPGDAPCWVVGVEDGEKPGEVWERIGLSERAVASSGNYRRFVEIGGESYGHLIDVRTGWPVRHDCQGVTVIGARCLEAGVLATTAFILGPHEGLELLESQFATEGCLQTSSRKLETREYHRYQVTS